MKTTNKRNLAAMFLSSLLTCATAYSQGWDAASDFSQTSNPNGAWSYGYKPSATGTTYSLCEQFTAGYAWNHTGGSYAPAIGYAYAGFLGFHPAGIYEWTGYASCLRWTAPTNGNYRISVAFVGTSDQQYNIGQTVYVIQNGTIAYQDTILSYGQGRDYTNSVSLSSGSTIDAVVANNSGVDNNWTAVSVSITPASPPPPPLLTIRISQVELCWQTVTNTWYQLQYLSTLTTNQWLPLSTNWVAGNGTRFCTTDAVVADSPQRFYQLSVTNSPPQ
jgi:hypothetical protein